MIAVAISMVQVAAAASAGLAVALVAGAATFGPSARGRNGEPLQSSFAQRAPTPRVAERLFHDAALDVDVGVYFWGWVGATALTVITAPVLSTGPLVVAVTALGPPTVLYTMRGRRETLRRRHLPVALDTVASSLRSGRSVSSAIGSFGDEDGPLAAELGTLIARSDAGRPLAGELAAWADTSDADTRLAGAALATAAELGGPAARALETTAQSLRDRAAADGLVDALSVQARLSAWLLTVAPIAFAGVMTGIDPEAGHFLFGTTIGWVCLAAGLGLDIVGGIWMHRMVNRTR